MVSEPLEEMTDRPTPETDAAANESIVRVYETSKRLERQRDDALEQLAAMTDQRDAALMTIRMMERRYEEED